MPYASDISEAIPVPLSNPNGSQTFALTGVYYDIAIAGQPFFLNNTDDQPNRRVTAQYRKQQIDQTREPGEQTLTGWWLRSQSTFHYGQGIKFFEPAQDESLRFQYTWSKGCNVWDKGQVTLLNEVNATHITTNGLKSNGRPNQYLRSIKWAQNGNTYDGCLLLDGYDIDKIYPTITATVSNKALTSNVATLTTSAAHGMAVGMSITVAGVDATFNGTYTIASVPTTTTLTYAKTASNVTSQAATGTITSDVMHFVDYNSGTDYPVYAMCDDGVYAYWITKIDDSGVIKTAMYKKALTATSSDPDTQMWKDSGIVVSDAVMEFTKERIVACINNKVYEIATSATSLPSAVYTHPTNDFVYTAITSSGAAIYVTGYSGSQSTIQKFTLTTAGAMPTLTSAITAAELPVGETTFKIYYYLGYMAIGTSKGVRIATVSDTDGSIAYGPLLFESEQPVYDFAAFDKYLWCTTNVDGNPGVTRVDLSTQIGSNLVFAYAWDVADYATTGRLTTSCAFIDGTQRLAFTTEYTTTNGYVYIESASTKVETAELRTGFVRYNTLENKIFKFLTPRFDSTNGGLTVYSVAPSETEYSIGGFVQGGNVQELGIPYPNVPVQYLAFRFVMTRSSTNTSKGPLFTGYQIKTLPSIPRQRLIQYPVFLYDYEMDKFANQVGYEGSAYDRLVTMMQIENLGDLIRVQDFRTGESYQGLIEEMDFINKTPTDKRFSGFGGVCLITIRTA